MFFSACERLFRSKLANVIGISYLLIITLVFFAFFHSTASASVNCSLPTIKLLPKTKVDVLENARNLLLSNVWKNDCFLNYQALHYIFGVNEISYSMRSGDIYPIMISSSDFGAASSIIQTGFITLSDMNMLIVYRASNNELDQSQNKRQISVIFTIRGNGPDFALLTNILNAKWVPKKALYVDGPPPATVPDGNSHFVTYCRARYEECKINLTLSPTGIPSTITFDGKGKP